MDKEKMEEIVNRLRTALWPMAIYRFDYPGNGQGIGGGEELNLCIVVSDDDESTYHKSLKAYSSLQDLAFPKNVIVRHESEFRKRSHWLDALEREIRAAGDLVYGRIDEGHFIRRLAQQEVAAAHGRYSCGTLQRGHA